VKDYLETFLSSSGDVKTSLDVTAETQEIDVYFRPIAIQSRLRALLPVYLNCLLCGNNYKEKLTVINNPY